MHYLLRKRNSIPLLFLLGALLFLCSFFFTNQALARSLGYKWYSPAGNVTVTFTVPFNDTWKTPIISSMNSWNSVSTKVPLNANGTGTGPHANEFYTVNTTSYTWIGKMFPTVYNYGGEQIFQSADIAFNLRYDFTNGAESGKYDIQSVATHELGHALGIAHCHDTDGEHGTSDSTWTMYNYSFTNSISARSLETYDINSKNDIYGS